MHCLTTSSSHYPLAHFNSQLFPSVFFVFHSRRPNRRQKFKALNLVAVKENDSLWGCSGSFKKGYFHNGLYWGCSGFLRSCKDADTDGDFSLEAEISEFIKNSKNLEAFPTEKDLVDAGRMDLVHAISKKGGSLAFGWDWDKDGSTRVRGNESGVASSSSAISSNRPVETKAEESGIEGILSRLKKDREKALLSGFREKEDRVTLGKTNYNEIISSLQELESEVSSIYHPLWSSIDAVAIQTTSTSIMVIATYVLVVHLVKIVTCLAPSFYIKMPINDALSLSLIMNCKGAVDVGMYNSVFDRKHQKSFSDDLKNARNRLRSILAKLAVLEGKMELAIKNGHKIVEDKQRRIDCSHRASPVLKTTYVLWPTKASEVLLAGSFDGWSTQRKMEKTSAGIFSVCLQLCPGKYEIKFIVDGQWKTDPLRPIVNNSGYENNILVVS